MGLVSHLLDEERGLVVPSDRKRPEAAGDVDLLLPFGDGYDGYGEPQPPELRGGGPELPPL
jgi:hypothetical protein